MNYKTDEIGDVVQGIEMIDCGDATAETKQGTLFPMAPDSCCTYTYLRIS